ncbi:leucine-rich_repeat domain-containing protein [Hexamita inflata]|uniref:Leucine-rich repeat domain-containing protein n=1 Tax=Hexamita inflata TaxID=28002 RepID=A0AA86PUF9_9EUKA|nr:leucine-rich repeat domain-containing protein [Hexamita inflata]
MHEKQLEILNNFTVLPIKNILTIYQKYQNQNIAFTTDFSIQNLIEEQLIQVLKYKTVRVPRVEICENVNFDNKSFTTVLFQNIVKLDLRNNKLKELSMIKFMDNLEELDLTKNNLESIAELRSNTKLKKLYLCWNKIREIQHLCFLSNLTDLFLQENRITVIIVVRAKITQITKIKRERRRRRIGFKISHQFEGAKHV